MPLMIWGAVRKTTTYWGRWVVVGVNGSLYLLALSAGALGIEEAKSQSHRQFSMNPHFRCLCWYFPFFLWCMSPLEDAHSLSLRNVS